MGLYFVLADAQAPVSTRLFAGSSAVEADPEEPDAPSEVDAGAHPALTKLADIAAPATNVAPPAKNTRRVT